MGVDGKDVTKMRDVLDAVGLDVGKTIEIKLRRGDQASVAGAAAQELTVYLTSEPEPEDVRKSRGDTAARYFKKK